MTLQDRNGARIRDALAQAQARLGVILDHMGGERDSGISGDLGQELQETVIGVMTLLRHPVPYSSHYRSMITRAYAERSESAGYSAQRGCLLKLIAILMTLQGHVREALPPHPGRSTFVIGPPRRARSRVELVGPDRRVA